MDKVSKRTRKIDAFLAISLMIIVLATLIGIKVKENPIPNFNQNKNDTFNKMGTTNDTTFILRYEK